MDLNFVSSIPRRIPNEDAEILIVVEFVASVIVGILNTIQVVVISKNRRKNNFDKVLLSLSCADFLFGVTNASLGVIYFADLKKQKTFDIIYNIHLLCVLTSIVHLLFISIDRVLVIVQPLKHRIFMTGNRYNKTLRLIWVVTIVVSVVVYATTTKPPPSRNMNNHNISTSLLDYKPPKGKTQSERFKEKFLSYIILCVVSMFLFIYTFIFQKSRTMKIKRANKVSLKCVMVILCFVVLTLPYSITYLATGDTYYWTHLLLVSNSGFNSIVYFFISYLERHEKVKLLEQRKKEASMRTLNISLSTNRLTEF